MKSKAKKQTVERCALCDCILHRGRDYAADTPSGRAHATRHHFVAERFFGRSANRRAHNAHRYSAAARGASSARRFCFATSATSCSSTTRLSCHRTFRRLHSSFALAASTRHASHPITVGLPVAFVFSRRWFQQASISFWQPHPTPMRPETPNHALQLTRPSRSGCNPRLPQAGSLSLGR